MLVSRILAQRNKLDIRDSRPQSSSLLRMSGFSFDSQSAGAVKRGLWGSRMDIRMSTRTKVKNFLVLELAFVSRIFTLVFSCVVNAVSQAYNFGHGFDQQF